MKSRLFAGKQYIRLLSFTNKGAKVALTEPGVRRRRRQRGRKNYALLQLTVDSVVAIHSFYFAQRNSISPRGKALRRKRNQHAVKKHTTIKLACDGQLICISWRLGARQWMNCQVNAARALPRNISDESALFLTNDGLGALRLSPESGSFINENPTCPDNGLFVGRDLSRRCIIGKS